MSEQLVMSVEGLPADEAPPRCQMCSRPAWWSPRNQRFNAYCSSSGCSNRHRICPVCDSEFIKKQGEAGTKYCSRDCKDRGYRGPRLSTADCAWCGRKGHGNGIGSLHRTWPYICAECTHPIRHLMTRLKDHRVPHDKARRLVSDPGCEVCGVDIVAKVQESRTGKLKSGLVVDHDHRCCPGSSSCGACVRGFLCQQCNVAAGLLKDDPQIVAELSRYLINCSRIWSSEPRYLETLDEDERRGH